MDYGKYNYSIVKMTLTGKPVFFKLSTILNPSSFDSQS